MTVTTTVWSESLWPVVRAVLAMKVEESARTMATDRKTKAHVSPPPRCFSVYVWVSAWYSDHDGVVRISVGHS